jgi:hypothetical protein
MTIDDASNSLKAFLYERAKTPFFATFVFSWIGWNWDFLYYLLISDDLVTFTIWNAKEEYINVHKGLLWPLCTSFVVTTVGGLFNLLYYWIRLEFKAIRIGKIEKKDTITTDQRDKIITGHAQIRKTLGDQIVGLEDEIATLRQEIEEVKQQNNNLLNERAKFERIDGMDDATRKEGDMGGKVNPSNTTDVEVPKAKYGLDRPIEAKNNRFETLDARILAEESGSVIAWFVVTKEHLESEQDKWMYILAHASSNGERVVKGGTNVYLNMWAIRRLTGKSPQWGFVISNENGTSNISRFIDRRVLNEGWHSIGITWSKKANRITFYVDGVRKESDAFKYWPDTIESNFTVGTWPTQTKREFDFKSLVGPIRCYDVELSPEQVEVVNRLEQMSLPMIPGYRES